MRTLAASLAGCALVALAAAGSGRLAVAAPEPGAPRALNADGILVAFKDGAPPASRLNALRRLDLQVDPAVKHPRFARLRLGPGARAAGLDLKRAIAALRQDPAVRIAEPDYTVHAAFAPNDPFFPQLWGLHNTGQTGGSPDADIDAAEAWDVTRGDASVVVAVIDTGVDYNHPDLAANMWTNSAEIPGNGIDDEGDGWVDDVHGIDTVNIDGNPMDDNSHGTHCAGTIGAVGNNGIGVAGVCHTVRIMPLKFLASNGFGQTSAAITCIDYARTHGAKILSNSWAGDEFSQLLLEAIQRARNAGILFVAAAGNEGTNNDAVTTYPASYTPLVDNQLTVAATDNSDQLAFFSNYGASVDLAAPGVNIYSTTPNNTYSFFSGTSMAAPHVSGAAALLLARYPGLTPAQLKARLLSNVDTPASLLGKTASGRLNVNRALENDTSAPGDPVNLQLTHAAVSGLRLTWKASGDDGATGSAARYELRYSTAPITPANYEAAFAAPGLPAPAASGATQSYVLADLLPDTAYYLALRAVDNVGNTSALVTRGPDRTLPATLLFSDNAEGTPRFAGPAPWAVTTEDSFSPTHCYADSPGVSYTNNLNSVLTEVSPVALTGSEPFLVFQAKTDLETDFDYLYVEVTRDGGATWTRVAALNGTSGWRPYRVPLVAFRNATVQLRFHLLTDAIVSAGGVWLDDIRIYTNSDSYTSPLDDDCEGSARFSGGGAWASSTETAWSPTHGYSDSPGALYGNGLDVSLTQSSPLALTGFVPVLTFMARTDLEPFRDYVYPEVSVDSGATWRRLGMFLTGTTAWTSYRVSLAAYPDQSVLVRFRLLTDGATAGNGVWLDDIRICGDQLQPTSTLALAAAPDTVTVGGSLSVTWMAPGAGAYFDWIGLFKTGTSNTGEAWWAYTQGAASGTLNLPAPNTPGTYEFRYFQNNGRADVQRSNPITVTAPPATSYTLTPSATAAVAGSPLSISWTAPTGSPVWDWIGLFKVDDPNTAERWWSFTLGASSGTLNLTAPLTPGNYEFRYLLNNGRLDVNRSATVVVGALPASSYSLTPSTAAVAAGGSLSITWTAPAGSASFDWIGLFKVGDPNTAERWWNYTWGATAGTYNLTAPTTPGTYEFRYFPNNGRSDVKRSAPIIVN